MQIPIKQFSDYFFDEQSVSNRTSGLRLQISTVCTAHCTFCMNNTNPFEMKHIGFRDIDEIEKILYSMPPSNGVLMFSDSTSGRLISGEPLIHPKILDIFQLIRRKYPHNYIQIITNGTMLTQEFLLNMAAYNPINLDISMHSVNKENWHSIFNINKEDAYNNAINSFYLAKQYGISVSARMVVAPHWFGWNDIEETIKFLSQFVNRITVQPLRFSNKVSNELKEKWTYNMDELSDFIFNTCRKYGVMYIMTPDSKEPLNIPYALITNNLRACVYQQIKKVYWLTSRDAYQRFNDLIQALGRNFPVENEVRIVENKTFGGNVSSTGLWLLDDLLPTFEELQGQTVFCPNNFLDNYGFDMNGINIADVLKEYKIDLRLLEIFKD